MDVKKLLPICLELKKYKLPLIKKFMCSDCFEKNLICEKCKSNLKKFNRLVQVFIEVRILEIKLGCPCLHKTIFNRIVSKMLVLEKEFVLIKELNLQNMRKTFFVYLASFPKYVSAMKKREMY